MASVDPNVIDPATGVPAGLSYNPETTQWTDASGNLWMPQQMDPNAPPTWTNQTEMAASGNYPNDATASWAQKLGIKDFNSFAARANSGNLTQDDIQKIGQLSSVAPQIDASGKVTNASDFFSGAVAKSQDMANASNKGKFLGINMDPGIADALTLGSAYLGGGYALADAPATATGVAAGDIAGGSAGLTNLPLAAAPATTSGATLDAILAGSTVPAVAPLAGGTAAAGSTGTGLAGAIGSGGGDTLAANVAGGLKVAPEATSLGSAITGSSAATGATGLTPGLATESAAGLGGGLSVPGVTGMGSTGAIGAAGATGLGLGGALAGSAAPAVGAATGGAAAGGTALGTAVPAAAASAGGLGATKVGDVLSGDVGVGDALSKLTLGDLSKTLGTLGLTAGSIYGDNKTADALKDLNAQYMAIGAPSRARYESSFDPNFDINSLPGLQGAMDTSTQAILRGLSTHGNPFGNPSGLADALKYVTGSVALPALQNYRNQNAASGGFGAFSTAAPGAATGSIGASGNVYADLGRGAANIFSPPTSLQDAIRSLRSLT